MAGNRKLPIWELAAGHTFHKGGVGKNCPHQMHISTGPFGAVDPMILREISEPRWSTDFSVLEPDYRQRLPKMPCASQVITLITWDVNGKKWGGISLNHPTRKGIHLKGGLIV